MAQPALPRQPGPLDRLAAAIAALVALIRQFVAHATRPFTGPGLPNWYIFGAFVLLLALVGSAALNVVLVAFFVYLSLMI